MIRIGTPLLQHQSGTPAVSQGAAPPRHTLLGVWHEIFINMGFTMVDYLSLMSPGLQIAAGFSLLAIFVVVAETIGDYRDRGHSDVDNRALFELPQDDRTMAEASKEKPKAQNARHEDSLAA